MSSGHWNHVDHGTGNHAKGKPEYIMCRHVDEPGPGQPGGKKGLTANQVYFGGHAQWRTGDVWSDGYWFDVVAKDHGEPGSSAAVKKRPDAGQRTTSRSARSTTPPRARRARSSTRRAAISTAATSRCTRRTTVTPR